jgi:hypothetical protein
MGGIPGIRADVWMSTETTLAAINMRRWQAEMDSMVLTGRGVGNKLGVP